MRVTFVFALLLFLFAVPASAQERTVPALPAPQTRGVDSIVNGSFETDTDWVELSLRFPGDLNCTVAVCGNAVFPRTGLRYIWFGGTTNEASSVEQALTIAGSPETADILEFYVINPTSSLGSDRFFVTYGGIELFELLEGTEPYTSDYTRVLLNLKYIPSGSLVFGATSINGILTNFGLDDVALYPNVPELLVNGSFEESGGSLAGWTLKNKSKDEVVCEGPLNCKLLFRGSSKENSKLSQTVDLTASSAFAGDILLASFISKPVLGSQLKAQLKVKYAGGGSAKIKLNANFNALHDDASLNPDDPRAKLYQLPPLTLTSNPQSATLTITHTTKQKSIFVEVDNVSLALLPTVLRLPPPPAN